MYVGCRVKNLLCWNLHWQIWQVPFIQWSFARPDMPLRWVQVIKNTILLSPKNVHATHVVNHFTYSVPFQTIVYFTKVCPPQRIEHQVCGL